MTRIVLASGNKGKLREFSAMFSEHFANDNVELIPQTELNVSDADETGLSFVENAIIKARHACQVTGLPALADDSGIEIDALDGAPGIYSARYSGEGDQANNAKVLENMKGIPEAQRTARFQCVLVYMRHAEDPTPQVFQGAWEGIILTEPSGTEGFGYDPIFYVPSEQCSAAELSRERKNNLSHRGQAIQQLLARWRP
ncbi:MULTISPECIES: RdgB/HAM1 family non-canonical purine NTP pyrophosphatase [Thalassolituus]|uniref:RdgB/HAM1 family non-canonical purine NTP pyrophosphatase n=1 Tax=Thalassolituus TaxID=187492 RepID=UPI000ECF0984|nr:MULTISPECIES: RdgB/HAM1 family non-canonical purine NTP pyrophosphatase [Thalassolituus]MEE3160563.1 RdgB/HAM1 family non-canonical purine NTP pyrophosphatase [Pseudomonadota bacterium]HCG78273.1 non-canonical purine NTP pyrophosphatase, RdgB/HAM1 family [Oceanospirillales bacterium]|tara:strand:- start:1273 stop:1869 length:597 start_codon:yes stop_codon:yes gene_type:complete